MAKVSDNIKTATAPQRETTPIKTDKSAVPYTGIADKFAYGGKQDSK